MQYVGSGFMNAPQWTPSALIIFVALIFWGLVWKGAALWVAAKRNDKFWFVVILVTNTLGVIEIIYLLFIAKDKHFRRVIGLSSD